MSDAPAALHLAQLMCARLCHDLGGPVGSVEGALGLLDGEDADEALAVAQESAETLRRRLRLYRTAWGAGAGDLGLGEVLELAEGQVAGGRARVHTAAGLGPGLLLPEALAQVVLNALLLAGEALPRGGVVRLAGDPARGLVVLPEGVGAAWPPGLATALAARGLDAASPPGPRGVLAPFLAAVAAAAAIPLSLGLGIGESPAPLLIGPPPPA